MFVESAAAIGLDAEKSYRTSYSYYDYGYNNGYNNNKGPISWIEIVLTSIAFLIIVIVFIISKCMKENHSDGGSHHSSNSSRSH